jgi:hypothetical protein
MKAKRNLSGYHWYIRAKNAEVHDFLLWHFELTKNLSEESRRDPTGRKISVLRVGSIGLLYQIREGLKYRRLGSRYYSITEAIDVYVRRSANDPLCPWPKPLRRKK